MLGRITIAEVHRATSVGEYERAVEAWAREVWAAWAPHHGTIRGWIERDLGER